MYIISICSIFVNSCVRFCMFSVASVVSVIVVAMSIISVVFISYTCFVI